MDHKTLEVKATTTTDLGEFTAIAAAYSLDRMGERIVPGAFKGTIEKWQESGKKIPLHWDHSAAAEDIIGVIDPGSMKETENGLEVRGKLDLDESAVAKDAWRLMKKDAVGLSFGYMVLEDAKGSDGIRELKAVDLFEVTITPAPANPDTRFMDLKSAKLPEWANPDKVVLSPEAMIGSDLKGAQEGDLKIVWLDSYITDLPDTAFLHERRFPYRDAAGVIDVPHLKNALARIPESDFPQDVKERLTAQAEVFLNDAKAIEDRSEEPEEAKLPQDPLEAQYDNLMAEITVKGIDTSKPVEPAKKAEPETPVEVPSIDELEADLKGIELDILTRGAQVENG